MDASELAMMKMEAAELAKENSRLREVVLELKECLADSEVGRATEALRSTELSAMLDAKDQKLKFVMELNERLGQQLMSP